MILWRAFSNIYIQLIRQPIKFAPLYLILILVYIASLVSVDDPWVLVVPGEKCRISAVSLAIISWRLEYSRLCISFDPSYILTYITSLASVDDPWVLVVPGEKCRILESAVSLANIFKRVYTPDILFEVLINYSKLSRIIKARTRRIYKLFWISKYIK